MKIVVGVLALFLVGGIGMVWARPAQEEDLRPKRWFDQQPVQPAKPQQPDKPDGGETQQPQRQPPRDKGGFDEWDWDEYWGDGWEDWSDDLDDGPGFAETRPDLSQRDSLTVTFSAGALEMDTRMAYYASEAQLFTGIYEGLFSYHPFTMRPVLGVASKYEVSDDKKQWTFTLRESAKYSNGDPVKAEDFRRAWLSLLSLPDAPYSSLFDIIEGAKDFRTGKLTDPNKVGIQVKDGKLIVSLNAPAAFFPNMLCHHSFSPFHPSMLNATDWSNPVVNGPFMVSEKNDDHITLAKNPEYWDAAKVALKSIVIKFTESADDATALWNSGQARWLAGDMNLETLTDRSGIKVNAMFATHYYFIRSAEKPWNDPRIRHALTLALPWDKIRAGLYLPAKTLIFPIQGYPEIDGLNTTDVDAAAALLADAGYPKGVGLPDLVIRITPSNEATRIAGLMAGAWMETLGVPVRIQTVPFANYSASLKQDDYEVGSTTWIGDFADPYTFLQMWRLDSNLNDADYADADYEALLDKSMTQDGDERYKTLAEAEKLLLDRGAVLPISYSPAINIIDTDEIDGWFPNVLDIHPFKYLSFAKLKPLPGVALGK
jgi:peptide/nickel transport system substrate-binding protein/oligopeptide transport system substrate-binding protein